MNKILQKFNIGVYFDILISADDVEHGKPSPEAYLLAASKLQVKPNKCLVIEDSLTHVQEARKIQMKTVYVNNNNEQITAGVSDFEVSSLDELLS
jgi:beta-phosphoglucomutase